MDAVSRFWARVSVASPPLSAGWLLLSAALAAVLVLSPMLWRRSRHAVTIAHEGAHGLAAMVTGRRLAGIRLHSDTSGLTVSAGRPAGAGMVLTSAAGYTGPGLFGLGAAAVLGAGYAVGLLWALLALLALLLVQIRNWYGLWSVLVTAALVFAATWWLPAQEQARPAPAVRSRHACPHCGHEPTIREQALQQRADLAEVWLEPNPNGELTETHHCAACAPPGPFTDLACAVCGDGPLLVGADEPAAASGTITEKGRRWLTGHGWQIEPELTCPQDTLAQEPNRAP